jgi:hypothetical protein
MENGTSENDDCIRTWPVSVTPTELHPRLSNITIRQVNGVLITSVMHQIVDKFSEGFGQNLNVPLSSYKLRCSSPRYRCQASQFLYLFLHMMEKIYVDCR